MKTATVADLRNHFRRVSSWIAEGQSIAITKRGRVVAQLVPPTKTAVAGEKPFRMPDFRAQAKALWGKRRFSTAEVAAMEAYDNANQEG